MNLFNRTSPDLNALPPLLAQDLEIIAGALRAGSSFLQAVQIAATSSEGFLANEWNGLLRDVRMGLRLTDALQRFQQRLPVPPVRSLVGAVTIVQRTGGNLAGVLLTLSSTLRQEIAFQGQLRAITAQGRMSGTIVSVMPFLLLAALSLIAPELMRPFFTTLWGWGLLILVMTLVAIGGFCIRQIVTIEV